MKNKITLIIPLVLLVLVQDVHAMDSLEALKTSLLEHKTALAVTVGGGIASYGSYRWYRNGQEVADKTKKQLQAITDADKALKEKNQQIRQEVRTLINTIVNNPTAFKSHIEKLEENNIQNTVLYYPWGVPLNIGDSKISPEDWGTPLLAAVAAGNLEAVNFLVENHPAVTIFHVDAREVSPYTLAYHLKDKTPARTKIYECLNNAPISRQYKQLGTTRGYTFGFLDPKTS